MIELACEGVNPERVVSEAVDLANVAMMIAHVVGGFREEKTLKNTEHHGKWPLYVVPRETLAKTFD